MVSGKRKSTVTLDSDSKKKIKLTNHKFNNNEYQGIKRIDSLSLSQAKLITTTKNNGVDDVAYTGTGKGFSVPDYLKKVFNNELGDKRRCDYRLVFIAVQSVLKESGFIGFDKVSRKKMDGFYLPSSGLKVCTVGKFINIYGSSGGLKSRISKVDKKRLVVALKLMRVNLDENNSSVTHSNEVVLEFWKSVKDNLALPLLIDLCEKANLPPPSCFTRLPADLKLEILELLSGADVARVACVSEELRFFSSDDELWKKKTLGRFKRCYIAMGESSWKQKFVKAQELEASQRKNRKIRELCGKHLRSRRGQGWSICGAKGKSATPQFTRQFV